MWEISLNHQALTVALSAFMGIIFCLLYDIFKATRLFWKIKTVGVFISDILFFIIAALIEFCFLLSRSNGEIRGFILAAEVIGFIFCRFTFSKIYLKILIFLLNIIKKITVYIDNAFCKIINIIYKFSKNFLKKRPFLIKKG